MEFTEFLLWEASTRDVIDFKKTYVDMCNDVLAGLMLSEIIYWHLPSKKGDENKLKVEKDGKKWIAVRRYEWWDRIRLSPRQSDRASAILKELGLVETDVFKFYGEPTVHVRLVQDVFLARWNDTLAHETVNPFSLNRENKLTKSAKTKSRKATNPLTESTAESTTPSAKALSPSEFQEAVQEGMDTFTKYLEVEGLKLAQNLEGKAWRGRELLPPNLIPYGDWWYSKTSLEMYGRKSKQKLNAEWQKAFKDWWENDVTFATLNTVYDSEKAWKGIISKPSELTAKAKALQVLPAEQNTAPSPESRTSMIRTIGA